MEHQAITNEKVIYGLNRNGKILLVMGVLLDAIFISISVTFFWSDWLNSLQSQSEFEALLYQNLPAFLLFVFITYGLLILWRLHLEVSVEGIMAYGGPFKIYTPWENIIGVKVGMYNSHYPEVQYTILQFRQNALRWVRVSDGKERQIAVIEKSWWVPNINFPAHPDKIILSNQFLTFPYLHWENTAFGTYFQQYAPEAYQRSIESVGEGDEEK